MSPFPVIWQDIVLYDTLYVLYVRVDVLSRPERYQKKILDFLFVLLPTTFSHKKNNKRKHSEYLIETSTKYLFLKVSCCCSFSSK